MTTRCENCGQPLLEGDTECWQCGQQVAGGPVGEAASLQARQKWEEASSSAELSPMVVYGGLTVFLIILALLATIYLGRQPLVQAASQAPPDGWAFISNLSREFVLMLPESWALFDEHDMEEEAFSRLVATNPTLTQATYPLGIVAEDLHILFVAADGSGEESAELIEAPEQFVVVAQSALLNRLSTEEALAEARAAADAGVAELVEAEYVDNFAKSHLSLVVRIPTENGELPCRQQLIVGVSSNLIVAACGPDQQLSTSILESFQRLTE